MASQAGVLNGNGNGGWRNVVLGILSTAVITSAVQWYAFVKDAPTRSEITSLQSSVTALRKAVQDLDKTVAVHNDRVGPRPGGAP